MTPEQMEKFRETYGVISNRKERQITSRRYNVIVRDGTKTEEVIEYLTMRQAREIKGEYNADGFICDIIEDVTVDNNGKEIVPSPRKELPIIKGVGGFGTPEATKKRIENDRLKARNKAAKRNKTTGKTITRKSDCHDPKSLLYGMYQEALKREHFEVRENGSGILRFSGLQIEVAKYLFEQSKSGYSINNFVVSYHKGA